MQTLLVLGVLYSAVALAAGLHRAIMMDGRARVEGAVLAACGAFVFWTVCLVVVTR